MRLLLHFQIWPVRQRFHGIGKNLAACRSSWLYIQELVFNYVQFATLQMPDAFPLILLMEEILHQLIGSLSHYYLQGFIHPRWCRIFVHQQYCIHIAFPLLLQPLKGGVPRFLDFLGALSLVPAAGDGD